MIVDEDDGLLGRQEALTRRDIGDAIEFATAEGVKHRHAEFEFGYQAVTEIVAAFDRFTTSVDDFLVDVRIAVQSLQNFRRYPRAKRVLPHRF